MQQTRENKNLNSKLIIVTILEKINLIANDGLISKDTEFTKNLDLNMNLNSSINDLNPNNIRILTSPANRNRKGKYQIYLFSKILNMREFSTMKS